MTVAGKVLVTDAVELLRPGIDLLRSEGVNVVIPPGGSDHEVLISLASEADAVIIGLQPFTADDIAKLKQAFDTVH